MYLEGSTYQQQALKTNNLTMSVRVTLNQNKYKQKLEMYHIELNNMVTSMLVTVNGLAPLTEK